MMENDRIIVNIEVLSTNQSFTAMKHFSIKKDWKIN